MSDIYVCSLPVCVKDLDSDWDIDSCDECQFACVFEDEDFERKIDD